MEITQHFILTVHTTLRLNGEGGMYSGQGIMGYLRAVTWLEPGLRTHYANMQCLWRKASVSAWWSLSLDLRSAQMSAEQQ